MVPEGFYDALPAEVKSADPLVPLEEAKRFPDGRNGMLSWKGSYRYLRRTTTNVCPPLPAKALFFIVILYETINEKGRKVFRQTAGVYPLTWLSDCCTRMVYPFGMIGVEKWDLRSFGPYLCPQESWREYDCRRFAAPYGGEDPKTLQKILDQMLGGKVHELLVFEQGLSRAAQVKFAKTAKLKLLTYEDLGPVSSDDECSPPTPQDASDVGHTTRKERKDDGSESESDCDVEYTLSQRSLSESSSEDTIGEESDITKDKGVTGVGALMMQEKKSSSYSEQHQLQPAPIEPAQVAPAELSSVSGEFHQPTFQVSNEHERQADVVQSLQEDLQEVKRQLSELKTSFDNFRVTLESIHTVSWAVHEEVVPKVGEFQPDAFLTYGLQLPCNTIQELEAFNERLIAEPDMLTALIKKFQADSSAMSVTDRTNHMCRKIFSSGICGLFVWKSPNSLYEGKVQFVNMTGLVALFNGVFSYTPPSGGVAVVEYEYRETSDGRRKRVAVNEPPYKNPMNNWRMNQTAAAKKSTPSRFEKRSQQISSAPELSPITSS